MLFVGTDRGTLSHWSKHKCCSSVKSSCKHFHKWDRKFITQPSIPFQQSHAHTAGWVTTSDFKRRSWYIPFNCHAFYLHYYLLPPHSSDPHWRRPHGNNLERRVPSQKTKRMITPPRPPTPTRPYSSLPLEPVHARVGYPIPCSKNSNQSQMKWEELLAFMFLWVIWG